MQKLWQAYLRYFQLSFPYVIQQTLLYFSILPLICLYIINIDIFLYIVLFFPLFLYLLLFYILPRKSITLKINITMEKYSVCKIKDNINIFPHINIKINSFINIKYITIYTLIYHLKFKIKMDIIKLYDKQNLTASLVCLFIQWYS